MAVSDTYSVTSGKPIYAGKLKPPITYPAWMNGYGANEWVDIPGTSGMDNNVIDAWCAFALVQETGELIFPLSGGHSDSYATQVSGIMLLDDAPAWPSPRRRDSIPLELANSGQPYCLDGVTPSSRHTRYTSLYCPQNNRIMLIGSPSIYGPGTSSVESNGFDLATNQWDPPGTWISAPNTGCYGSSIDDVGNIWCRTHKFITASNTLTPLPVTYAGISAFDTSRRKLFTLAKGNGQGFSLSLGIVANTINENLSGSQTITFNSSAAYTEFSSMDLDYSCMDYDPVRDRFLYYYGKGVSIGVIYVITPNSGTVWDMSKLVLGPNSKTVPEAPPAGTNGRFKYLAAIDSMILIPKQTSNIFAIRLS